MKQRRGESGNVMFYIILGVALLGALSFAIAQGSRSPLQTLTEDRRKLVATEVISFGNTMASAVSQLRLRGTPVSALRFAHPDLPDADYGTFDTDPANEVFNLAGGAVSYKSPPSAATTTGTEDYQFLANNAVELVGTTCTAASCAELVMILPNVQQEVCIEINEYLDVDNPAGAPPVDTDIRETEKFQGTLGYSRTIGDEDNALEGQKEACLNETGESEFVYYKVLLSN